MSKIVLPESYGIRFSHSYDKIRPEGVSVSHCHDVYEILLITSGKGRFVVESSSLDIKAPVLLVIKPYQYHSVILESDIPYERYVINFSDFSLVEETQRLLSDELFVKMSEGGCFYSENVPDNILSIFERLDSLTDFPQLERGIYTKLLLSEMILLLSVIKGELMKQDEDELGARVIKYLNDNIDKDITLDKLSRRFFVSKYYLCRAFKKHNGISVHGYITQKRVMYAKQLIENGETASGAAYKVGFGDYSAFYRAYIKIVGKSPTAN